MTEQVYKKLKEVFSFDTFREPQETVVLDAIKNIDQFVLLPTGTGKSLCFQLPAILQNGITIVISPLKSLILDQINNFNNLNTSYKAVGMYSDVGAIEKNFILRDIVNIDTKIRILYTTPETLDSNTELIDILQLLNESERLVRFVIDEAHCISLWGNDFRNSYRKLSMLKEKFNNVPIMACTASATPQVQKDLLNLLNIESASIYTKSYYRKNLNLIIEERKKQGNTIANIIDRIKNNYNDQSGIVYCISRANCTKIAKKLTESGIDAEEYHAGLTDKKRKLVQNNWKLGILKVIVATVAFGMGIDKPDVRFIIHYNCPSSLENYYQEIGRGGRDGKPTDCILYYSYQDYIVSEKMVTENDYKIKNELYIKHQLGKLRSVMDYCENFIDCRHKLLCQYFGESLTIDNKCHSCDNCLSDEDKYEFNLTNVAKYIFQVIISGKSDKQDIKNKFTYSSIFEECKANHKYDLTLFNRILHKLVFDKFIKVELIKNDYGFWDEKYKLYSKAKNLINNNLEFRIELPYSLYFNKIK